MKKIAILLVTIAIFSGCNATVENSQQTTTNTPSTNSDYKPVTSSEQTGTGPSLVDQVALDGAVRLNDPSYCEKISDANIKQQCLDNLKPQEQAKTVELDCEKLENNDEKEACLLEKQIAEQLKQQALKEQEEVADGIVKRDQFINSKDLSSCEKLTVYGQKYDCQYNILLPQAVENNNKSICSQASMPEVKEACEMNFDKSMAIKAGN